MFKSLAVVTEVHREDALPAAARSYARDRVTLGWEERVKVRGRRTSDGGVEFGTALPRGTTLSQGDCLVLEQAATVVQVVEQREAVLIVRPRTPSEWGLFAYYIGNSHQPVMILDQDIVCADVPGMQQVLDQHAIPFSRATRPFTPVSLSPDGHRHGA
jgi:urease accessory protein UreE